jgi:hypothetical protein
MKSHKHTTTTKSPREHQKRAPNAHYKTLGLSIMAREKRPHKFSFIGSALARERKNWAATTERRRKFPFGLHILRGGIFTTRCCCYCEVENCE